MKFRTTIFLERHGFEPIEVVDFDAATVDLGIKHGLETRPTCTRKIETLVGDIPYRVVYEDGTRRNYIREEHL